MRASCASQSLPEPLKLRTCPGAFHPPARRKHWRRDMPSSSGSSSPGELLRCLPVAEDQFPAALEHLKLNFFADEPLNRAMGLCARNESNVELERHCLATLKQHKSLMIVDESAKIVGTALNGIIKQGEREECERRLAELEDEKLKKIFGLLYKLNEKVDLFAKYGVDKLFECRILSVDEAYRGRGLANLLVGKSIETARQAGFKVIKADATGMFSQRVFLKYDFKVVTEIPYSEVPENLRPGPPHQALKLLVKVLE